MNVNVAGSFGSGRREINWDGVPPALAAPSALPADFFNTTSPRGIELSTPGTGFQVSGAVGGTAAINFGNFNAGYTFQPFSAQRMFTAVGSNVFDVYFFVPGTSVAAVVDGFGAVFEDVDQSNTTSVQFFDVAGANLGTYFVPSLSGGLSIGASDNGAGSDVVVNDDFIYGEPVDILFADGFE